jgi:DNA repair protein RecN (Recombination protein N)
MVIDGEMRSQAAMLEEVRISGLGVIDEAVLELSAGFNVVTGETGAGKTMVVSGLGLLFGGRGDPTRVRPGADRASVEGRLSVEPEGQVARQVNEAGGDLDDDGRTLILSRSVSVEGRSRAHAGGRSVPVSLLTYLADDLVAVHGQADQQQLLKPGRQRAALDRFGGQDLTALLAGYQRGYERHRQVKAELDELVSLARERANQAADLRQGLTEIEQAEPAVGEDIELKDEEERLSHADALHTAATTAHEALLTDPSSGSYEGSDAVTLLGSARQALESAASHDAALAALAARVSEAAYLVSDVAAELASYAQSVEADPARLAVVQERRAVLGRLIRSYGGAVIGVADPRPAGRAGPAAGADAAAAAPAGPAALAGQTGPAAQTGADGQTGAAAQTGADGQTGAAGQTGPAGQAEFLPEPVGGLGAVLAWAKQAAARLAELDSDDDRISSLTKEEAELAARVADLAEQLTAARKRAASQFAAEVTAELTALAMPHASLSVAITPLRELGPTGGDEVEIKLAAHPGAPTLALHKGASGGELSRIMLSIEVVFAGADPVPTFVFDEVDAGVGGKAATEVGRRLARLARLAQVIVVTHLPQVAAFADTHLVVEKADDGSVTSSGVTRLDEPGRVRELSRMLAGLEDSELGRAHANELLVAAAAERARMPGGQNHT